MTTKRKKTRLIHHFVLRDSRTKEFLGVVEIKSVAGTPNHDSEVHRKLIKATLRFTPEITRVESVRLHPAHAFRPFMVPVYEQWDSCKDRNDAMRASLELEESLA